MNGAKLLAAMTSTVWCITEEKLNAIIEVIERKIDGVALSDAEIDARLGGVDDMARDNHRQDFGQVAVLSLSGIISQKANMVTRYSGGTSTQQFGAIFREAVDDNRIRSILINIDSPGGNVNGVRELSRTIHAARGAKRIVAVADPLAASAAYWIGSSASELYLTDSGQVGSVGAMAVHVDESGALSKRGIKVTILRAGENKTLFNNVEPMEGRALEKTMAGLNRYRDMFLEDVARNRTGSKARPPKDFGAGDMFVADEAVRAGLADGVMTFEALLASEMERAQRGARLSHARAQVAMASREDL